MENSNPAITIEPMTVQDLDGVLVVEHASFSVPWSRASFYMELTQNEFAYYLVIKVSGHVVGYAGMWLVVDEAHVTNITLLPAYRGQRLGEVLLRTLTQKAKQRGAERMTLEVRRSNEPAKRLYTRLGFEARGVRKNYYSDTKEDAIIMWLDHLPV